MLHEDRFEDEIELIDILRVLWKRKALIVLGTFLLTSAAAGMSFLLPQVYEVTAIVEPGKQLLFTRNGQIIDDAVLQSPAEAIKETVVGGAFDEGIRNKLRIRAENFPEVNAVVPKKTELVKLSIESTEPQRAKAVLEEVVTRISRYVGERFDQEKSHLQSDIKVALISHKGSLAKEGLLERQIEETTKRIQELEADRKKAMATLNFDAVAVLLYSNQVQNNQIYLNNLKRSLKDVEQQSQTAKVRMEQLQVKLAGINATKVHKEPTVSPNPVKPKRALIVSFVFILGLMTTTVLAFLVEYIRRENGTV